MDALQGVEITFNPSIDSSVVSDHAITVLKQVLLNAGLESAKITSTIRTLETQANAMYEILRKPDQKLSMICMVLMVIGLLMHMK